MTDLRQSVFDAVSLAHPVRTFTPERFAEHGARLGALGLQSLLVRDGMAKPRVNPLAARPPHFAAKARSVIFLFMVGAPSQMDSFDPKPLLKKFEGQPLPESLGRVKSQFTDGTTPILASLWEFKQYGQCSAAVSSLFPHLAKCVDDLCFVRSFYTESVVHAPAMYQVQSGRILMGHPSMGSWVTYGLGSESDSLPAYCVVPQGSPRARPKAAPPKAAPPCGVQDFCWRFISERSCARVPRRFSI